MLRDTIIQKPQFRLDSGIIYFYDSSRSKWVSSIRENLNFGLNYKNISLDRWMKMVGSSYSNTTGYKIPRPAVITAATVQTKLDADCKINIRRNGNSSNLYSLVLNNEKSKSANFLNIDINVNDFIQAHLEVVSGSVYYPQFWVELCWCNV